MSTWCEVRNFAWHRFPDRDPTGFCNSESDPDWTGFRKNSTEWDMDIQTVLITAVKCLIRVFFVHKPDWIKHLDRSTGFGSDRITQWKFWTGLGLQKSPSCSTLVCTPRLQYGCHQVRSHGGNGGNAPQIQSVQVNKIFEV